MFGDEDVVGTLNMIDQGQVLASSRLVRTGKVFSLNAPLDVPNPPLDVDRKAPRHRVIRGSTGSFTHLDDVVDSHYPQASSQWDSLGHIAYAGDTFYNGASTAQVLAGERNNISVWSKRGIVGRAVMLDVARFCADRWGSEELGSGSIALGVDDLEDARQSAHIDYTDGCILLLHTGFLRWYKQQSESERTALPGKLTSPGLDHTEAMAAYLWDNRISAVAADNFAVEVWPPDLSPEAEPFGFLHRMLIGQFGMALGELWHLEDLAADCADDGIYECMLASTPWHLPGGIGSPANALAIK